MLMIMLGIHVPPLTPKPPNSHLSPSLSPSLHFPFPPSSPSLPLPPLPLLPSFPSIPLLYSPSLPSLPPPPFSTPPSPSPLSPPPPPPQLWLCHPDVLFCPHCGPSPGGRSGMCRSQPPQEGAALEQGQALSLHSHHSAHVRSCDVM